jgi:hypothetical protein
MISPIVLLNGNNPLRTETGLQFSGWYGIERLSAEGPFEDIIFPSGTESFIPKEGPLAQTKSNIPCLWVLLTSGHINIAPKTSDTPPPPGDNAVVRGYYELDQRLVAMIWHSLGAEWDENEIEEVRALSNPAYLLYKRVHVRPTHIFVFGAGASFGSDGRHLLDRGLLPPLGNGLYPHLRDAPELKYWKDLPTDIIRMFESGPFEPAMAALDQCEDGAKKSLWRDIELARFFSRYRPEPTNLYWKLAHRIAKGLSNKRWSGAAITLNYERLLEEACMRNLVFTTVKGVTYYDDNLPPLQDNQLFEVCYPHGACQFFMAQTWFEGEGDIVFGETARLTSNVGANHLLDINHIPTACDKRQIPLICRYHPSKRPSVDNYFIRTQQARSKELISNAKVITIVGAQCFYETDAHLWGPLASTDAKLFYVEPGLSGQEQFRTWALSCDKREAHEFSIIPKTFKDAFDIIFEVNSL